MSSPGPSVLDSLRQQVAAIERRPALAGEGLDAAGIGYFSLPAGVLHEVFTSTRRDGGAGLGFALGLLRDFLIPARPALVFVQLVHDAQEAGLPYGAGLAGFGLSVEDLVFVRPETSLELLWAVEEAVRCAAVAAVIADIDGWPAALDFTASRRLSLRAAESGTTVLLLRHGPEREASAAQFRWHVAGLPSASLPYDDRAPGRPRWQVTLEKGRLASGAQFILDWTDHGFAPALPGRGVSAAPPLSRPRPAVLGHRLSQAG